MSTVTSLAPRRKAPTPLPALAELDELAAQAHDVSTELGIVRRAMSARYDYYESAQVDDELSLLSWVDVRAEMLTSVREGIQRGQRRASREEIGKLLALLLGSFPATANALDPAVYGKMMVEEVAAAAPSVIALDSACRKIRRTHKWPPAIAEILEILKSEEKRWSDHLQDAGDLPNVYQEAMSALTAYRDQLKDREQKEQAA